MKILVGEITESPKTLGFSERVDELNKVYTDNEYHEFRFPSSVDVRVVFYRSGQEIFFAGFLQGVFEACCSRCLEVYGFPVEKKFEIVLAPDSMATDRKRELNKEEMGLSFYQGAEINLAPLIREQILLSLPIRPLCAEECRGLCAGCGVNLNKEACLCVPPQVNERLAFFRSLRMNR
jgi:DUF177 domain-containing protein